MRESLRVFLVIICLLAGCGMKGPLYLPDEEPVTGTGAATAEADGPEEGDEDERRSTTGEGGGP